MVMHALECDLVGGTVVQAIEEHCAVEVCAPEVEVFHVADMEFGGTAFELAALARDLDHAFGDIDADDLVAGPREEKARPAGSAAHIENVARGESRLKELQRDGELAEHAWVIERLAIEVLLVHPHRI